MSHSIIPPSSSGIWGKPDGCPGWVMMAQMYPETEETPEAMEGDAAHEIGAALIQLIQQAAPAESFIGQIAPNGIVYTDEMYEAAKMYADDVTGLAVEYAVSGGLNFGVERHLDMPDIHELSHGTTDAYLYSEKHKELIVWDFKYGFEVVEAYENWQGINYVAGLLDLLDIDGHKDQSTTVRIRIVQPRAHHRDGPIREWKVMASDLRGYINILSTNAAKALSADAHTQSGSHCKHCPGRHACDAALTAGVRLFEVASKPVPVELDARALGVQFAIVQRARKQLEYLESGFEERIKAIVRGGESVDGYRVEEGIGRERWTKPDAEVLSLGDMLGHDLRNIKPVTPNQARKLGVDGAVISAYSEKPRTGLKLVPDNGNKAKQVFQK